MTTTPRMLARRRAAFSLIEIVAVVWALGIVMFLGVSLLLGTLRVQKASAAALQRQTSLAQLADVFRADVAGASDAPKHLGDTKAGSELLILRHPDGKYVCYRWHDDKLERAEVQGSATPTIWFPMGGAFGSIAFSRSGPDRRLITIVLTDADKAVGRPPTSITAALGGDLQ